MSTTNMYKYVHGEAYTASKIAQPVSGTGFVDIVGSDGVTPIAYTAIKLFDDAVGTTELVIDVDFEVGSSDARYTALEALTVYRQVRILNATYQSAVFYADFSAVGGYVTRETFFDGDNTYSGDNTFSGSVVFTGATPQVASAWVNFNGTGAVAIRDDYNVDSITDNNTGDYTVNIDVDLADANYSTVVSCSPAYGVRWTYPASINVTNAGATETAPLVGAVRIGTRGIDNNAVDIKYISVQIFGGV